MKYPLVTPLQVRKPRAKETPKKPITRSSTAEGCCVQAQYPPEAQAKVLQANLPPLKQPKAAKPQQSLIRC